jgi:Restriction endonuclease
LLSIEVAQSTGPADDWRLSRETAAALLADPDQSFLPHEGPRSWQTIRRLEELVLLIFKSIQGFEKTETRRRNKDEEIDLIIPNESKDPFWSHEHSSYFLGECKNWSKPVGPDEFDRFRAKMKRRHGRCRLGFFIAVGGFTDGFSRHVATLRESDDLVIPLGPDDLKRLVETPDRNALLKDLHKRSVTNGNGH